MIGGGRGFGILECIENEEDIENLDEMEGLRMGIKLYTNNNSALALDPRY